RRLRRRPHRAPPLGPEGQGTRAFLRARREAPRGPRQDPPPTRFAASQGDTMPPTAAASLHPFDAAVKAGRPPYKVADLSLAELGRKEIRLAEHEMPGLMAVRRKHAGSKPPAGP